MPDSADIFPSPQVPWGSVDHPGPSLGRNGAPEHSCPAQDGGPSKSQGPTDWPVGPVLTAIAPGQTTEPLVRLPGDPARPYTGCHPAAARVPPLPMPWSCTAPGSQWAHTFPAKAVLGGHSWIGGGGVGGRWGNSHVVGDTADTFLRSGGVQSPAVRWLEHDSLCVPFPASLGT